MILDRRHRPFQFLALATVLVGLVPAALGASLADPVLLAGAYLAWTVAVYLGGAAGTLLAATTFAPGEPMRPGWLLLAGSYAVLVPARLLAGADGSGLAETATRLPAVISLASILSSALAVAGFLVLTRAWGAAGLDTASFASRATATTTRLVALLVGVALAGPDLVERFPRMLAGDTMALADVVADVLDVALFVVAVPVLRAARALGGGLVAWPWALLTLSLLAWLGYDASVTWPDAAGLSARHARVIQETMRALAACAALAAGVAQRWIMLGPPGSARDAPPPA